MSHWRLLVTRAEPGASAQAGALRSQGHYASVLPLVGVEPLPVALPELNGFSALIVVSQPAAQALLRLFRGMKAVPPPLFAVGAATAAVLGAAGHAVHWPVAGEHSEALLALPALDACLAAPAPRILIARGQGGREALAEGLRLRGASVEYLELYRRYCPQPNGAALLETVQAERLNALVVSSGQGFETLHALAAEAWPQLAAMPLFVPSQRVAELALAARAQQVRVCDGASSAALAECLAAQVAP